MTHWERGAVPGLLTGRGGGRGRGRGGASVVRELVAGYGIMRGHGPMLLGNLVRSCRVVRCLRYGLRLGRWRRQRRSAGDRWIGSQRWCSGRRTRGGWQLLAGVLLARRWERVRMYAHDLDLGHAPALRRQDGEPESVGLYHVANRPNLVEL